MRALTAADVRGAGDAAAAEALLSRLPCRIGAVVPRGPALGQLDVDAEVAAYGGAGRLADFSLYAVAAARAALQDASAGGVEGLRAAHGSERVGVSVGTGIGALHEIVAAGALVAKGTERRLSPYFVPTVLGNMAAGHVSLANGLRGPNLAAVTACAASAHAIGEAYRCVRDGAATAMLAGGAEGAIDALALTGFSRLRALSTRRNDDPGAASRPFDAQRDGFVMGEGAAVLVLEELEMARARGARAYCELRGFGASGDAHHVTQPAADGAGAAAAMRAAMREAGLEPSDVGYVNAHATSTPQGDTVEVRAVSAILGHEKCGGTAAPAAPLLLSSTKGATGHLLGAAGAVEAAFTALAVAEGTAPATRNLEAPDDETAEAAAAGGIELVTGRPARPAGGIRAALTNSFGFAGTNACLALTRAPEL